LLSGMKIGGVCHHFRFGRLAYICHEVHWEGAVHLYRPVYLKLYSYWEGAVHLYRPVYLKLFSSAILSASVGPRDPYLYGIGAGF